MRVLVAAVLATGVALGGAACQSSSGIHSSSGSAAGAPAAVTKPDLTELSDGMVLKESSFPSVPGGKFTVINVRKLDPMAKAEGCNPRTLVREGGQEAGARIGSESTGIRYSTEIFRTGTTHDVHEWAGRCLPVNAKGNSKKLTELPGLPAGAVGVVAQRGDKPITYLAMGFVRGIFVVATVGGSKDGAPADAKSDVVKLFNSQAELLNSR